jgi:hypothetical protein
MKFLSFLLALVFVLSANFLSGQDGSKALVSFQENKVFVSVINPFRVVIQQQEPVSLDQLSAVLLTYGDETKPEPIPLEISQDSYGFSLEPGESGIVEITVTLQDGTKERYSFHTKPITAVARVGGLGPKNTMPIRTNILKSQKGLRAPIEGFHICGSCNVLGFEMIYITSGKDAEITTNSGGNWEPETAKIISLAKPGDRYIFTKIRYRCPGALEDQLGETLSFELK